MSKILPNSDKLATLSELRYLLLEVLDREDPIPWYDLSFSCKEQSLNFAFAFENSVAFLQTISLIQIHVDKSVSRLKDNYSELGSDEAFGIFIIRKTAAYLEANKLLDQVLNKKTIAADHTSDTLVLYAKEIPDSLQLIRSLLFNLGVLSAEGNNGGELTVATAYRNYFRAELLPLAGYSISSPAPVKIPMLFISYAYKDKIFKDELQKHLSGMKSSKLISDWEGRAILPGEDWDEEIRLKLEQAEIVLFLVSSDFMASEYINDVELKKTMERHKQGKVRIIPVIVRPCDFHSLPIGRYMALPDGAKAVSQWKDKDEAYLNIVTRLKDVIRQLSNQYINSAP